MLANGGNSQKRLPSGAKQAAEKGQRSVRVGEKRTSVAKSRDQLDAFCVRVKTLAYQSCSDKKQGRKLNKTRRRHGVLRTPTHRTKTKTSDGWGTVSSPVGRRSRWTTRKKQDLDCAAS